MASGKRKRATTTGGTSTRDLPGGVGAGGGQAQASRVQRLVAMADLSVGRVSRALAGALALGRVSHAYVFAAFNPAFAEPVDGGGAGSGGDLATAAALSFARRLNCEAPSGDSACGKCLSCRLVADANHPDVRLIAPDGLSVKIDQVRDVKREMSLKPRRDGGFRVIIIEGAEKMTTEAQNSLLKLLEEPPERAVLILVCTNLAGLLPTVRSRCQLVRVRVRVPNGGGGDDEGDMFRAFVDAVRRAGAMSPLEVLEAAEAFEKLARAGGGARTGAGTGTSASAGASASAGIGAGAGTGAAAEVGAEPGAEARAEAGSGAVGEPGEGESGGAATGPDARLEPRQWLEAALVEAAAWFRDALVLKSTGDVGLAGGGRAAGRLSELARDAAERSVPELMETIDEIEETRRRVRKNANMRLALEAMFFTLKRRRRPQGRAM